MRSGKEDGCVQEASLVCRKYVRGALGKVSGPGRASLMEWGGESRDRQTTEARSTNPWTAGPGFRTCLYILAKLSKSI